MRVLQPAAVSGALSDSHTCRCPAVSRISSAKPVKPVSQRRRLRARLDTEASGKLYRPSFGAARTTRTQLRMDHLLELLGSKDDDELATLQRDMERLQASQSRGSPVGGDHLQFVRRTRIY